MSATVQKEIDKQKARLESLETHLNATLQDLAALKEEINKAMAETNDTTAVAKRASEQPAGVQGIRSALEQPDDLLAKHPEYMAYAAATTATGTAPISALR